MREINYIKYSGLIGSIIFLILHFTSPFIVGSLWGGDPYIPGAVFIFYIIIGPILFLPYTISELLFWGDYGFIFLVIVEGYLAGNIASLIYKKIKDPKKYI